MADGRLANPAKSEAGEGNAKLRGGDVVVEVLNGLLSGLRAAAALFGKLRDAGAARPDERELGGHEEAVHKDQHKDCEQSEN